MARETEDGLGVSDPKAKIRDMINMADVTEHNGDSPPPIDPPHDPPPAPPGGGSGEGGSEEEAVLARCAAEPETDIGNGRRFLHRFYDEVLHVSNIGWHCFDGCRWAEDEDGRLIRPRAHLTAESIAQEVKFVEHYPFEIKLIEAGLEAEEKLTAMGDRGKGRDPDPDDKAERTRLETLVLTMKDANRALATRKSGRRRYAKTSGSSGKLDNMLREAAPYRAKLLRELDADPLALNTLSGTLRFSSEDDPDNPDPDEPRLVWSVRQDPHDRADFISKLVPVRYDPDASADLFDAFLERVQPQEEMRGFLKRYFGYSLTALTDEQCFVFFYGEGRNGKSTLVDLMAKILGDYSTTVPFETLAGDDRRKGGEATPDLARLPGARMVRAAEPEQGMKFRESMIKSLTSGEPILIRRLHAEFNEVYPTFKLIISGNHKPDVRGADDGIWRRVYLFPWDVQIPVEEVDPRLLEKLWAERSGILNWLIEGALDYLNHGLQVPDIVRSATDTYREESDPVGAFLNAYCKITGDPDDTVDPKSLYAAYKLFCEAENHNVWTSATFNRHLPQKAKKLGFSKSKTAGLSIYRGIRLKADWSGDVAPPGEPPGDHNDDPGWQPDDT
ncbi:MAG: hypothetical protein JJ902_23585 [Roseibium sp.]|nr:hypothetical protein [Roseibium sp.]